MYLWNIFDLSLLIDLFLPVLCLQCILVPLHGSKTNLKLGNIRCSVLLTYIVSFAVTQL